MQTFKKIVYLFVTHQRKRALLLLLMILIMALLDMIGVASIMPFMAVLTNPSVVETNPILKMMFQASNIFGVETNQQFLIALGVLVFVMLVTSLTFKALTTWVQLRFIVMLEYNIGKRLIEGFLNQPYSWFLNRHSADLGKVILSQVKEVNGNAIGPMFHLISQSMVTIALVTLLFLADPKLSLIISITLGSAYLVIFKYIKGILERIGKERHISDKMRFESVTEAFGAAKEVKVGGLEKIFIKRFSNPAKIFARHTSTAQIISQIPRYLLEIIAFGGILLVMLYFMVRNNNFETALPLISLYAFAGYRLMPALQKIYISMTQLRFVGPALNNLYDELKSLKQPLSNKEQKNIKLNNSISLKNVCFNYPNMSRTTLKNINLNINVNSTVGIVGATGSGKTTLVDIILGLLESQQGTLEVDSKIIRTENVRAWQRCIGYVPQNIFLADDTIAANIAFGVESKDVDQKAVESAAKSANLHEFISKELSLKYQTIVGERGIRLSGGQRQRIGIARAIYHNPKLLVFDEATSALDNQTEALVMKTLKNLKNNITIILIAHRLSTVKECDNIFVLENGKLVNEGRYNNLLEESLVFKKLAQVNLGKNDKIN
tara:strand:+ start:271 stop:2088 length:1818 start_codon:yes stop_codon:yes gene_type:complete